MLKNEKGFSFYEAIISLNILVIFCVIIVPSITLLLQKKEQAYMVKNAEDILTDSVHSYYLNREEFNTNTILRKRVSFSIYVKQSKQTKSELCVGWYNRSKESEICEDISE
jgi:competence protein ComGC